MKIFFMKTLVCMALAFVFLFAASSGLLLSASGAENVYYFSRLQSTEDGAGYVNPHNLSAGDPLVGVHAADIVISGFSAKLDKDGTVYFLKTNPDVPKLSIEFKADFDNLGGTGVWINEDGDTRIPDFGFVGQIGFGWLGIEHTDYQGVTQTVCVQNVFQLMNDEDVTPAWFGAEGSYRISVCFETKRQTGTYKNWHNPFYYTKDPVYGYNNYRIDAAFEIRNANAQVFCFDEAGNELFDGMRCQSFTLDYANTHYLNVSVKREVVLSEGTLEETKDVRFNSVGVDQREYCTPGVYTITASNPVTGAVTERHFIVGNKSEANQLSIAAEKKYAAFQQVNALSSSVSDYVTSDNGNKSSEPEGEEMPLWSVIAVGFAATIGTMAVMMFAHKRKKIGGN